MKIKLLKRTFSGNFRVKPLALAVLCTLYSSLLFANPQGGVVVGGSATISTPAPNTVQINQTSNRSIINWQSYNIGGNEKVRYVQPNSGSISLNKINPTNGASQIYGSITANGQVWLINPAGIYFGPNAYVDVGGLIATTSTIRNQDFMAGRYQFTQSPNWQGSIINDGRIIVRQAGLAAFIGTKVINNGKIEANLGTVVLGSGPAYTVDFSGDQLIQFAVQPAKGSVSNNGQLIANGGKVILEAYSAGKVLDNVINMKGVIEAKSVSVHKGEIILNGGDGTIRVSGKMIASGDKPHTRGGTVKIRSKQIEIVDNALIDTSGFDGGGIISIGGNAHGSGPGARAEVTRVGSDVKLNADALQKGNGGQVIVWGDQATEVGGSLSARGGLNGGDGGFIETSGKFLKLNNPHTDTSAPMGKTGVWLLDPTNITIGSQSASIVSSGTNPLTYSASEAAQDSYLLASTLSTQLDATNVIVTTSNASGTGDGDINVVSDIGWNSGNTLTLNADRNIVLQGSITTGAFGSALILNAPGDITQINGSIKGSGGLVKQGVGTMTLSKANPYKGSTTVSGGTLSVTTASGLGDSAQPTTVESGATLEINGVSIAEPLTLNGSGVATNDGALKGTGTSGVTNVITLASDSAIGGTGNLTLSGLINGSGGINKTGSGTLSLTNTSNSYTGSTTISGGTVSVNKLANSGIVSSLGPGSAGPTIVLNGGKLSYIGTGASESSNRAFSIGSGGGTIQNTNVTVLSLLGTVSGGNPITYDITSSGNIIVGGEISGTGTSLTKTGSGTGVLQLTKANSYTGSTTISAGTLTNGIANALPTGTALTVNGLYNLNSTVQTIGSLSGSGTIRNNGGQIFAVGDGTSTTFSGVIGDAAGNSLGLTKQGSGTLTLSGSNGYTGSTIVGGGTLVVANNSALGPIGSAVTTITTGGTLEIANLAISENLSLNSTGVNVATGGLSASGTSSLSGTLTIAGNSSIGGTGTLTINGLISGAGSLAKEGVGTVVLTKNNTSFSGSTTINNGVLSLTNAGGLGTASSTTINSGGTLDLNNVTSVTQTITVIGSGSGFGGTGALTGTNISSLAGGIHLGSDITIGGTGTLTLNGVIDDLDSSFGLIKTGTGTVTIPSTTINTFDGSTTINQGTLAITADSALGNVPQTATADKLIFNGGTLQAASFILNSNRGITLSAGGGTILTGTGTTLTYNGIATGSGNLTKTGSGILLLGGANSYTGATNINVGTVKLNSNNSVPSTSAVVLSANTTFDLNGKSVSIGSLAGTGGKVSSASGSPTLTVGNDNASTSYSGTIQDAINITKVGNGTLALNNSASTYSGQTRIDSGTLSVSKLALSGQNSSLGRTAAATPILIGSANAATLSYSGSGDTTDRNITINGLGGGTIQTTTVGGTLTLSGTINSVSDASGNSGPITFDSTGTINVSGQITGVGTNLVKVGDGVLSLTNSNSYSGGTTINAGTITLTNAQGLGTVGNISVASGSVLDLNFANAALSNGSLLTLNGTGISDNGALTFSNNNITVNNPISLGSATKIGGTGTGIMNFGGSIDGGSDLTVSLANAGIKLPKTTLATGGAKLNVAVGGPISQNDTLTIAGTSSFNAGANTIDLSTNGSNNGFFGAVTLLNSGNNEVRLDSFNLLQLNTSTVGGSLTVHSSSFLTLIGVITANDIKLGASRFTNTVGASALNPGSGRWLVWSGNNNPFTGILADHPGNLVYDFKQYNLQYSDQPTPATGNGFLYSYAPVIVPSLTGTISKMYDGNAVAHLSSGNYAFSGVVDNDVVKFNLPTTGVYDTKNAGTGKNVSASGISIDSAKKGIADVYGYQIISDTGNVSIGEITRAPITVTSQSDTKLYDGKTISNVSPLMTSGSIIDGDSITTAASQVFDNKNAGTGKSLIASGLVIDDGNAGNNYLINYETINTGEITRATVNVNAQPDTRVYNGTTSSSVTPIVSGIIDGDTVATAPTQTFIKKNVGTGLLLTADGLVINDGNAGDNYFIHYFNNAGEITKATVNVYAQHDARIYNGTTSSSVKPIVSGIANSDTIATAATQAFDSKHVGTGKTLSASGLVIDDDNAGANYNIIYTEDKTGVITAAPLIVNAQSDSRGYNGTAGSTIKPVVSGTSYDPIATNATQVFNNKNAGVGKTLIASGLIMDDGNGGNNYQITYVNFNNGIIDKAPLTVTAKTDSRVYNGRINSNATPDVSGIMYDSIGTNAIQRFDNKNAGSGKSLIANGLIMNDGNGGNNYLINYVNNTTGVINKASLTVTAKTDSRVYNGTINSSATPTISGNMYDSIGANATQKFNNKNAGSGKSLIASGLIMDDGNGGNNYLINYVNNTTGVISKAPLSVTAKADIRNYNGTTTSIVVPTITGNRYDLIGTQPKQIFSNKHAGINKLLIASGLIMNDGNAGNNYSITYINNSTGTINKAPLTVTAKTNNRVYNGTTSSIIAPTISGTMYDAIGTRPTQVFNNKNVGTSKQLIAKGLVMNDGNAGNNYKITYITNNTGVITKAPLDIKNVTANNKVYNANTTAKLNTATALLKGVYSGDVLKLDSTLAVGKFVDKNVGNSKAVTTSGFKVTGVYATNYALRQPSTIANITPAPLKVNGIVANNKIYDGSTKAILNFAKAALSGVYAGDNVTLNIRTYTANFATANPGTNIHVTVHSLGVVGTSALNYTLVQPTNLSASILKPR